MSLFFHLVHFFSLTDFCFVFSVSAAADVRRRAAERKASLASGSGGSSSAPSTITPLAVKMPMVEASPMQTEQVQTSAGAIVIAAPKELPVVEGSVPEKKRRTEDAIPVLKTYRPSWG